MSIYFITEDDVLVETEFDEEIRIARAKWRYDGLAKDDWLKTNLRAALFESGFTLKNTDENEMTISGPVVAVDDVAGEGAAMESVKRVAATLIEQMLAAEKAAIDILCQPLPLPTPDTNQNNEAKG